MNKIKYFSNKIAIVTGGGSGIGKTICEFLVKYNAKVIIADINYENAKDVEHQIIQSGGFAKATKVDVSNELEIKQLIEDTFNEFGKIDLLFNNAGISVNGEFQDTSLEYWQKIINVNLWGVVFGCHYAYPIMMKQGFGQIINTSSLSGLISGGLTSSYSTSKYAVVGFSMTLRAEAKQYGIKINTLCPGVMNTSILETTPIVSDYLKVSEEKENKKETRLKWAKPEKNINQIMRGVRRNKGIIVAPRIQKIFWNMNRMFPGFSVKMFSYVIKTMKNNYNKKRTSR